MPNSFDFLHSSIWKYIPRMCANDSNFFQERSEQVVEIRETGELLNDIRLVFSDWLSWGSLIVWRVSSVS